MATDTGSKSSGIGLSGALGVAFIVLKLTHTIAWSWWWVLAPFWIGWAIVGVFLLFALLIVAVAAKK
jgi:Transmembrane Fragile-X-F protein